MFEEDNMQTKTSITEKYRGKQILLIDGGSRQVLPMIKGFHDLGCIVSVYCGSKFDVGRVYRYTDYVVMGAYNMSDSKETYQGILKAVVENSYDLIIPMNDFVAGILSQNKTELSKYTIVYVNDYEIYEKACDKLITMSVCMENGIPCPRTALVSNVDEIKEKDWSFPVVVKPRSSYGANGFNVVKSFSELADIFHLTEKKFGPPLVQEYIEQTGKQYQVEMMMDSNNECKAIVIMDKVRWYPITGGSSTLNVTIHDEEIKITCIKLLQKLHWRGYASLDLIRDPKDNIAKIIEINPRINGTAKICFAAGVNLSLMILQDAFDDEMTSFMSYPDGVVLRYFHMDVLWFIKSPDRFKTKPSWFSFRNTVDEIFEWRDLRPAFVYTLTAFKKLAKDKSNRGV
jgi:D-aspartate ligase